MGGVWEIWGRKHIFTTTHYVYARSNPIPNINEDPNSYYDSDSDSSNSSAEDYYNNNAFPMFMIPAE